MTMKNTTLGDLPPNPGNPRRISDTKLEMLKRSIDKFGDLSGFVFNRHTKRLAGGHQRQKVMPPDAEVVIEHSHMKPTRAGTIAEGYVMVDGERFKYREVLWSETTEEAANIAANQHGGEWDLTRLSDMVLKLDHENIDLGLLGFDDDEFARLMAPVGSTNTVSFETSGSDSKESDLRNPWHKCPRCSLVFNDQDKS